MSLSHLISATTAQAPEQLVALALLSVSLLLIFAGRTLVKVAAFLVVGAVGAVLLGAVVTQYVSSGWGLAGALLGFIVGGVVGVVLLPLAVGLALGYGGYLLAHSLSLSPTVSLLLAAVLLVVGVVLSGRILSAATAVVGGLLLFNVLVYYGFGSPLSTVVAATLTVLGLYVQFSSARTARLAAPGVEGQTTQT